MGCINLLLSLLGLDRDRPDLNVLHLVVLVLLDLHGKLAVNTLKAEEGSKPVLQPGPVDVVHVPGLLPIVSRSYNRTN